MKIIVLCGSPHPGGTTNELAEAFIRGAKGAGCETVKVWLGQKKIAPCLGCNYCRNHGGTCITQDDMPELAAEILEADVVVFVSPLYYFGMTAQLKAVIDRFYASNGKLREQHKKAVLLCAGADDAEWAMDGIMAHYETMLRYMNWESAGEVLAYGCGDKADVIDSEYTALAENLGKHMA